jgi:four helix bundle protein
MGIQKFEDLLSWQKWQILAKEIYLCFRESRDFSFKDQIQRAAVSISSNIAEGFERQTNKEFRYFLYVSKWSCGEFRSLLMLGKDLWYIQQEKFDELYTLSVEISRLIAAFIKSIP